MSPADVIAIAKACAQINLRYEAFVLMQGLCGLRPGEAVELHVRNLTISNRQPTAVTVRGTHAEVPDRFLLDGETRRPLKGRGHRASRTIPAFTILRPVLARHVDTCHRRAGCYIYRRLWRQESHLLSPPASDVDQRPVSFSDRLRATKVPDRPDCGM